MSSVEDYYKQRFKNSSANSIPEGGADYYRQRFESAGKDTIRFPIIAGSEDSMGAPGLEAGMARFGVAEGRNFTEKLKAFRKYFPEGELALSPVARGQDISKEPELLFRKNKKEKWSVVDAGMTEKFEPLGDIIDFVAENAGSVIGEVIATTPAGKTVGLLGLMARLFAGAQTGDIVQQVTQEARGLNTESWEDVVEGAAVKGVGAAVGGAAGSFFGRLANMGRGAGVMQTQRGAEDVIKASNDLGLPPPLPQQLVENPAFKRAAAQSAAATSYIPKYLDDVAQSQVKALDSLPTKDAANIVPALSTAEQNARNAIIQNLGARNVPATTAGRRIQLMVDKWDSVAKTQVNQAYTRARQIQEPQFDLAPARAAADNLTLGVMGIAEDGAQIQLRPLKAELMSVISDIKKLDPSIPRVQMPDGRVISAADQLQALRQRLFDLKTPDAGVNYRQEHALAGQLYGALNDVLKNPKNVNPAFAEAWQNAEKLAARRFDLLEKLQVQKIAKSESPSQLVERLARPNNAENIALLRRLKQPKEFQDFQDFFKSKLLDMEQKTPGSIVSELNSFDKPTLNLILSKEDQTVLRDVGQKLSRLADSGIQSVLKRQEESGRVISELFRSGRTAETNEIYRLVQSSGGKDSALGRSVRAGLIEDIKNSVLVTSKGGQVIDFKKLDTVLRDYEKNGLNKFLTPQDIKHLKDQRLVSESIKAVADDAGTSISAAEAAGNVVYRTSEKAIYHMLRLMGFGRFLTMPIASKLIIGTGKTKEPYMLLKQGMAAAGIALADADNLKDANQ